MKYFRFASKCLLLLSVIFCAAVFSPAQDEGGVEVTGFYQQYRDFSFKLGEGSGVSDFEPQALKGGGFGIAYTLEPWFAFWTQFAFYGSMEQAEGLKIRIINNSQGPRWQKNYGRLRLYVKGGLGFSHFSIKDIGGETKLSLSYGGGAQIWTSEWLGVTLDVSHYLMGVPNLTDLSGRDKWDSGLTFTPGVTIKF